MNLLQIVSIVVFCNAAIVSTIEEEDCSSCEEATVCLYKCKKICSKKECSEYCMQECSVWVTKCKSSTCTSCSNKCWKECSDHWCSFNCINECSKFDSSNGMDCVDHCSNRCNDASCKSNCINQCSTCQSSSCSSCYNQCSNGCQNTECNRGCLNQCSNRCASCKTNCASSNCKETCTKNKCNDSKVSSKSSNNSLQTNSNSSSISNPKVDVRTTLNISNDLKLENNISNPITVNSSNINTITLEIDISQPPVAPITIKPTRYRNDSCCLVVPPQNCTYNNTNKVNCNHDYYKECSPRCQSPIVVPHPVYIRVPYPVPIQVPYPVYNVRYAERPYPVYIQQYVNKPVYVPVNQPVPYPVNRLVPQPYPVAQPYPVHFQKNVYIPQPYPQPVVYNRIVPQYIQQPCPLVHFGGTQVPVCRNIAESQKYIYTNQNFLVDSYAGQNQFPISLYCGQFGQNCHQAQLQQCGGCLHCHGSFNMNLCLNSNSCPPHCRQIIGGMPSLQQDVGKILKCTVAPTGQTICR